MYTCVQLCDFVGYARHVKQRQGMLLVCREHPLRSHLFQL